MSINNHNVNKQQQQQLMQQKTHLSVFLLVETENIFTFLLSTISGLLTNSSSYSINFPYFPPLATPPHMLE